MKNPRLWLAQEHPGGADIVGGCPAGTVGKETKVEMAKLVLLEWLDSGTTVSAGELP